MYSELFQGGDKKDETDQDAAGKKMADSDSDSDEEEHDNQQKEKGISNKKKKVVFEWKVSLFSFRFQCAYDWVYYLESIVF